MKTNIKRINQVKGDRVADDRGLSPLVIGNLSLF